MQRVKDRAILVIAGLAAIATFVVAGVGCQEDDVGIPCNIGASGGDELEVRVNPEATDCRSRLCLKYATVNKNVTPVCTEPCDSADDCPDDSPTCSEGYACVIGQTVEGGLQCCKLCVCKRDVRLDGQDPQATSCQGIASKCPNI